MLEYQQSEPIAARRYWIIVLVDSTDGVTGKTGQTGQVYVSKNGATPALSANSIVEVDSTNMPGHYYVELTASELDTLGFISITKKTASTLAFHDRAIVSYNNPYTSTGGFAGASGPGGVSKSQAKALLEDIRKIVKEEIEAAEADEIEIPPIDYSERFDQIVDILNTPEEPEIPVDFTPVLEAITALPTPTDYAKEFSGIVSEIKILATRPTVDVPAFIKSVDDFTGKMALATKDINGSIVQITALKSGFDALQQEMDKFKATLAEQSDMDRRFDAMNSATNNKKIEDLTKQIKEMMLKVVNSKYDILKELTTKK